MFIRQVRKMVDIPELCGDLTLECIHYYTISENSLVHL